MGKPIFGSRTKTVMSMHFATDGNMTVQEFSEICGTFVRRCAGNDIVTITPITYGDGAGTPTGNYLIECVTEDES